MISKGVKGVVVFIFILFSIHFWRYIRIPEQIYKLTDSLSWLVFILSLILCLSDNKLKFKKSINLFLLGIFLNVLSAYFNNGQSIRDTVLSFGPYYFILFYYFLHKIKPDVHTLERIIIIFGFLYAIFYLIQTIKFPEQIFAGSMFRDRGTIRIRIEGNGFLMLAYFLLLNKYLMKRNVVHLFVALFLFLVLIKSGFRTLTLGAVLMSGIIFLRLVKYSILNYALIVVAVFLFIGLFQLPGTSRIIENMIHTSKQQMEENDKYIRRLEYDFFRKEYPRNFSYYVVGGGLPGAHGSYARYMGRLIGKYGYYWDDLGLIGFYFVVGGIALLGLLIFTFKAIFSKLPPEGIYLSTYFGYLFIVSFTTMEIFRPGIFSVEAIGLYLLDSYFNQAATEQIE